VIVIIDGSYEASKAGVAALVDAGLPEARIAAIEASER
jgi:hypothetical protein